MWLDLAELLEIEVAKSWPCRSGRIPKTLRFDPLTSQTSGLFVAKFKKLVSWFLFNGYDLVLWWYSFQPVIRLCCIKVAWKHFYRFFSFFIEVKYNRDILWTLFKIISIILSTFENKSEKYYQFSCIFLNRLCTYYLPFYDIFCRFYYLLLPSILLSLGMFSLFLFQINKINIYG